MREKEGGRDVRNLGLPVDLAARYFDEGADEVRDPFFRWTRGHDGVRDRSPLTFDGGLGGSKP